MSENSLSFETHKTIDILGSTWSIDRCPASDEESFKDGVCMGCTNGYSHKITLCYARTVNDQWKNQTKKTVNALEKQVCRHEIVHAFLDESGLGANAMPATSSWAENEEMVDWFAIQGPKIYKAWEECGAL